MPRHGSLRPHGDEPRQDFIATSIPQGTTVARQQAPSLGQRSCGDSEWQFVLGRPQTCVRRGQDRVRVALGFFDASINCVTAYMIGSVWDKMCIDAGVEPSDVGSLKVQAYEQDVLKTRA